MARLSIKWRSTSTVAPKAVLTGKSEEESAVARTAAKPMMVYVTADDPAHKYTRKLEDIVFANEAVGIGSKFFDTIKMTSGDALQDRLVAEHGKDTPRILFISRDYEVTAVMEKSKLSAGKLLKAMKTLARKEYKNSFDKMVRGYTKLLNELDRLEGRRAKLADDRARLQAKPNASKEKKVARDEKKYEADVASWEKKEQEILEFKVKGEKPAPAEA